MRLFYISVQITNYNYNHNPYFIYGFKQNVKKLYFEKKNKVAISKFKNTKLLIPIISDRNYAAIKVLTPLPYFLLTVIWWRENITYAIQIFASKVRCFFIMMPSLAPKDLSR